MAFSDTVYSGPMLEGLNRAKLAYMDQDTQRLRDEQTLRAALARVEAMNRQTDAGERNSQMEWGTRGRLGDNQNLIAASDAANRMELGRMGDSTTRYGIQQQGLRSADEIAMRQYLAEQNALNEAARLTQEGKNAIALEKERANTFLAGAGMYPMGTNMKGLADVAAMNKEVQDQNDMAEALARITNQQASPESYQASKKWNVWDPPYAEYQRQTYLTAQEKNPTAIRVQGGTNAVPNLRPIPFPGIVPSQPTPQPGPMPAPRPTSVVDQYIQQYGPAPMTRIPGTSWGPNFVVGPNGQWMQRTQ